MVKAQEGKLIFENGCIVDSLTKAIYDDRVFEEGLSYDEDGYVKSWFNKDDPGNKE